MNTKPNTHILNTAAYQFKAFDSVALLEIRKQLYEVVRALELKGTILLSTEGINLFLAGTAANIQNFKKKLPKIVTQLDGTQLRYKDSWSNRQPFSRMLIKIKKEIIPMGMPSIRPAHKQAPYIQAALLKKWYDQGYEMILLDTRNTYEIALGTFKDAIDLGLENFRQFPEKINYLSRHYKKKPIITFCTGGIRCEKAANLLIEKGFHEVYQLQDGILGYFEQCGSEHFNGECFVFDRRVAIDAALQETNTIQCYDCRNPIVAEQQKSSYNSRCPYCKSDRNYRDNNENIIT